MIKVGLTGGIGSGKSTVAKLFEAFGIPVFYADEESKKLLDSNKEIKSKLIAMFGDEIYMEGVLNRKVLASKIFNDEVALQKVNEIAHPAVEKRFLEWTEEQNAPYVLQEAAILFETGGYKRFDKNILVTAPKALRIQRIMKRDNAKVEQIEARMQKQWDENHKLPLADFVILNDGSQMLLPQIRKIHESILRLAASRS